MTIDKPFNILGTGYSVGDHHYRAYVGPPEKYDLIAAMTFNLLTTIGLRQYHRLLEIGCGSLRVGRLLIPYLNVGNYHGLEPNKWLVEHGIKFETGHDLINIKKPKFFYADDFKIEPTLDNFNFMVAQSIFSHASLKQISQCLSSISDKLLEDGAFLATFIVGKENYTEDNWVYPECVSYKVESIKALAEKSGLVFMLLDWRHPHDQSWALFYKPNFDIQWFQGKQLTWNLKVESGKI